MMLSSTMSTLIGGTVPSTNPPKVVSTGGCSLAFFGFRAGRGDVPRAGGVFALFWGDSGGGSGGVGTGGVGCAGGLTVGIPGSKAISKAPTG